MGTGSLMKIAISRPLLYYALAMPPSAGSGGKSFVFTTIHPTPQGDIVGAVSPALPHGLAAVAPMGHMVEVFIPLLLNRAAKDAMSNSQEVLVHNRMLGRAVK